MKEKQTTKYVVKSVIPAQNAVFLPACLRVVRLAVVDDCSHSLTHSLSLSLLSSPRYAYYLKEWLFCVWES